MSSVPYLILFCTIDSCELLRRLVIARLGAEAHLLKIASRQSYRAKVEARGINLEKTYEEITDEEYWNIRNILIENNYSTLRNINPAPPYEYSTHEDKVVNAIENLLQRTIIQDLSWFGKAIVILVWVGSFAAPFLLNMDFPFLSYHAR